MPDNCDDDGYASVSVRERDGTVGEASMVVCKRHLNALRHNWSPVVQMTREADESDQYGLVVRKLDTPPVP